MSQICTYTPKWTSASEFNTPQNGEYYINGIIIPNYKNETNGFNTSALTWRNAKGYLDTLTKYYTFDKPSDNDNASTLQNKFNGIANGIQGEYCYYMNYYRSALELLLSSLQTGSTITPTQRDNLLSHTVEMNMRLNALTSLTKEFATIYAAQATIIGSKINAINAEIQKMSGSLVDVSKFIENSDSLLTTRKEMIRYTAEKNNHITNQISLWAALNVLAIGTIFAIYRNM